MEEPKDRLQKIRAARGYRSARLAAYALDVSPASYGHHENGTRGITTNMAKKYASFFGVSLDWLLSGSQPDPFAGPPLKQHSPALLNRAEAAARVDLSEKRGNEINERDLELITNPEAPDPIDPDAGAHYGSETGLQGIPEGGIAQLDASGGMGGGGITIVNEGVPGRKGMTFAAEAISDFWRLPAAILAALGLRTTDVIMLQVKGDSNAPVLLEGDYVMVDTRHRWPSPDGFYAFLDDFGEIIVKRLRATDDEDDDGRWVEIISANPAYPTRKRRVSDLRIIGRVNRRFSAVF